VSVDVIGRRRAVEQRLARARSLAQALDKAAAGLAETSGQSIEVLDPDGSLRTALSALAGIAALRPHFDIMVALPGAAFALRVQHVNDDVEIEILQRDGPGEPPAPADQPKPGTRTLPAQAPSAQVSSAQAPSGQAPSGQALSVEEQPPENPPDEGHVAFDLAAMLWQNVGEQP
jgi:hypothetical protein